MARNRLLAALLASTCSVGASAAMVTVDAGNYSFHYDDSYWSGATFSRNGDVFSFSNLVDSWGSSVSIATNDPNTTNSRSFRTESSIPIRITTDAGYKLHAIQSGVSGSVLGEAGYDPSNPSDTRALGDVSTQSAWRTEGPLSRDVGTTNIGASFMQVKDAFGNVAESESYGNTGSFNRLSFPMRFGSEIVTALSGRYFTSVGASASRKGSWAEAWQDTASFHIAVIPVPEPETWAMFLAGLGVLGVVARRRKRTGMS